MLPLDLLDVSPKRFLNSRRKLGNRAIIGPVRFFQPSHHALFVMASFTERAQKYSATSLPAPDSPHAEARNQKPLRPESVWEAP